MRVKVVRCCNPNRWYADKIGEVFEVVSCEHTEEPQFQFKLLDKGRYFDYRDVEVVKYSYHELDDLSERVVVKGNVIKVKPAKGYSIPSESTLLKLTDTGNGYIAKFPSYSSALQDNYICLGYSEADYLFKALKAVYEQE